MYLFLVYIPLRRVCLPHSESGSFPGAICKKLDQIMNEKEEIRSYPIFYGYCINYETMNKHYSLVSAIYLTLAIEPHQACN